MTERISDLLADISRQTAPGAGVSRLPFTQEHSAALDTMVSLAEDGMSMICVTHELNFARNVAHRIIFMDQGRIIEDQAPEDFFNKPKSERAKLFLDQILSH